MSKRDRRGPGEMDGMQRREFLQKVLAAAVGLPAAASLLGGCSGDGILEPDEDNGGDNGGEQPAGDLQQEAQDMRDLLADLVQAMQDTADPDTADLDGWLAQLNAQLALVWPLMAAAGADTLRGEVVDNLEDVATRLDGWEGVEMDFSGDPPEITRQTLQNAWGQADGMVNASAAANPADMGATRDMWLFLFLLFVTFPGIDPMMASSFAASSADYDEGQAGSEAEDLYDTLHDTPQCTPCLVSALFALALAFYFGMQSEAAQAPGMLFGGYWMVALVLLGLFVTMGL